MVDTDMQVDETERCVENKQQWSTKRKKRYDKKEKNQAKSSNKAQHTIPGLCSSDNGQGKIFVFGDSHAKDLSRRLEQFVPSETKVFVNANSGAPLDYVLRNCENAKNELGPRDIAVIIAGTNDVSKATPRDRGRVAFSLPKKIREFISSGPSCKLAVVSLFHRHDLHPKDSVNLYTMRINQELMKIRRNGVAVIDVRHLHRGLFTRHGQHLSGRGKNVLCQKITDAVKTIGPHKTELRRHTQVSRELSVKPPPSPGAPAARPITGSTQAVIRSPGALRTSSCHPHDSYASALANGSLSGRDIPDVPEKESAAGALNLHGAAVSSSPAQAAADTRQHLLSSPVSDSSKDSCHQSEGLSCIGSNLSDLSFLMSMDV